MRGNNNNNNNNNNNINKRCQNFKSVFVVPVVFGAFEWGSQVNIQKWIAFTEIFNILKETTNNDNRSFLDNNLINNASCCAI